jgi:flavin reductase (DIM6/NTAB) family NADH-FMN oxidoreductase RutF
MTSSSERTAAGLQAGQGDLLDDRAAARADAAFQDPVRLRQAFGCFPSGVTAVCGVADGRPAGLTASSFTSVSLHPALVSVCMATSSTTWPVLRTLPGLGVSVLAETQVPICQALAAKGGNRFAEVRWEASGSGAVFIRGAALWLDCTLEGEVAAGDHDIALLRIRNMRCFPDVAPLVFHRSSFRRLAGRED